MRFSKHFASIAVFVLAALLVYLIGTLLLGVWPMWTAMWAMMGFGVTPVLVLVVVALLAGTIWALAGSRRADARSAGAAEHCSECGAVVDDDYVLCPECHTALRATCPACRRSLKARWTRCPFCGTDAAAASSVETVPLRSTREPGDRTKVVAFNGR